MCGFYFLVLLQKLKFTHRKHYKEEIIHSAGRATAPELAYLTSIMLKSYVF